MLNKHVHPPKQQFLSQTRGLNAMQNVDLSICKHVVSLVGMDYMNYMVFSVCVS